MDPKIIQAIKLLEEAIKSNTRNYTDYLLIIAQLLRKYDPEDIFSPEMFDKKLKEVYGQTE